MSQPAALMCPAPYTMPATTVSMVPTVVIELGLTLCRARKPTTGSMARRAPALKKSLGLGISPEIKLYRSNRLLARWGIQTAVSGKAPLVHRCQLHVVPRVGARPIDGHGAEVHRRSGGDTGHRNVLDAVRADLLHEDIARPTHHVNIDCLTEVVRQVEGDVR